MKTAFFSGLALAFVVMAAQAAMDQSRDSDFEKDKVAYIRQYAWPRRTTAGSDEVLFSEKKAVKSVVSTPEKPAAIPPSPPPPESE